MFLIRFKWIRYKDRIIGVQSDKRHCLVYLFIANFHLSGRFVASIYSVKPGESECVHCSEALSPHTEKWDTLCWWERWTSSTAHTVHTAAVMQYTRFYDGNSSQKQHDCIRSQCYCRLNFRNITTMCRSSSSNVTQDTLRLIFAGTRVDNLASQC